VSSVYSTQFFEGTASSGLLGIYTVQSGFVAIVRDVSGFLLPPGGGGIALAGGTSLGSEWLWYETLATLGPIQVAWRGRLVIPAGESFDLTVTGGGSGSAVVSGYLLTV
jgi:hypothetical protein